MNPATRADEGEDPFDHEAVVEHVRNAWLNLRILDHVDLGTGGGYAFDPSDYAPVPAVADGEQTVVFART